MKRSQVDSILDKVHKRASAQAAIRGILPTRTPIKDVNSNGIDDDDEEEYVPVGVGGLIAASQKLLAINRGLDKTDARDALMFKRILTPDRLIGERIKLDAEGIRRSIMNRVSRSKSLSALHPFTFDGYTEKFIVGNPLSSPLEEINPLHLVEQSRRVTQMGPGGIGTDNAITQDMQSIATDQFGFISPTEGPECLKKNTYVFTQDGWKFWEEVKEDTLFACNIDGLIEFHKATALHVSKFEGELICIHTADIRMSVTPNHRVYYTTPNSTTEAVGLAVELYNTPINIPEDKHNNNYQVQPSDWSKEPYNDLVYCATVPGSKLLVRGSPTTQAYWTGNSERVGIDVRLAWGTKIGSDGKPYQKFFDRRAGKQRWMSPEDLDGMTIKVPD